MEDIIFDEEKHEYVVGGLVRKSCTQVIETINPFLWGGEEVDNAADLGCEVHLATAYLERGELGNYDPKMEPWLNGWKRFLAELPELLKGCRRLLVDIKTGQVSKSWPVQLGGYSILSATDKGPFPIIEKMYFSKAYNFCGTVDRIYHGTGKKDRQFCVRLIGDNDYKIKEWKSPHTGYYENIFISFLNVCKWRETL